MKHLTAILFATLSFTLWGQSSPARLIDSAYEAQELQHLSRITSLLEKIEGQIDTNATTKNAYHYYLIKGINAFDYLDVPISKKYVSKSLSIARTLGDSTKVGRSLTYMGNIQVLNGNYSEALQYFQQALKRMDSLSENYFSTQMNMSQAYLGLNHYDEALKTLTAAKEHYIATGNHRDLAVVENNIGEIYRTSLHDFENARLHYLNAAKANQKIENALGRAQNHHNMAALYLDWNMADSAMSHAMRSQELRKSIGDSTKLIYSNYLIGSIFMLKEQFQQAIPYYQKALAITKKDSILRGVFHNSIDLGQVYYKMGKYSQSLQYLMQALDVAKKMGEVQLIENTYTGLFEVSRAMGDYKKAIEYLEKKTLYNDSVQNLLSAQNLNLLRTEYEMDLKEAENQALKTKELVQYQKLESQNNLLILSAISIFLLLVAGLVLYRAWHQRNRALLSQKETNQILGEQYEKLKQHEEKLKESNDLKNKILSVLGHDLRAPLAGISSLLSTMSAIELTRQELDELLHHLNKEVDISLDSLQQILVWARLEMDEVVLRPEAIDVASLFDEVRNTYEVNARAKNLRPFINVEAELTLYADKNQLRSIIGNLFSNAIKFSPKGERILMNAYFNRDTHKNVIEIVDFGDGIAEDVLKNLNDRHHILTHKGTSGEKGMGIGLRIAYDFVAAHRGKIWFETPKNGGTKVSVLLPVTPPANESQAHHPTAESLTDQ